MVFPFAVVMVLRLNLILMGLLMNHNQCFKYFFSAFSYSDIPILLISISRVPGWGNDAGCRSSPRWSRLTARFPAYRCFLLVALWWLPQSGYWSQRDGY